MRGVHGQRCGQKAGAAPEYGNAVAVTIVTPHATLAPKIMFEAVIVPLYLIALPYFYGVPRLGSAATLLGLAIPFVLALAAASFIYVAVADLMPGMHEHHGTADVAWQVTLIAAGVFAMLAVHKLLSAW